MKNNLKSKAGVALFAAAAMTVCIPANAAPAGHGGNNRGHWSASAHHGHHYSNGNGWGLALGAVAIGALLAAPAFASPPVYYPPAAYYPPEQPAYVEPAPVVQQQGNYWYYCRDTNAYYPYVQQCQSGWQQVVPQPPAPGGAR